MSKLHENRTVALLQARMSSARLPGKVLADLGGKPMLEQIITRVGSAKTIDSLVVACGVTPHDDPIAQLCGRLSLPCFRGSDEDCLDRLYQAACAQKAETVVRLTGDNPVVDAGFVDWVVGEFRGHSADFASSSLGGGFPLGLSVEIMTMDALTAAWKEDSDPKRREHVTPFIYKNPDRFRVRSLACGKPHGDIRWTVDTLEDLVFARILFGHFGNAQFSWQEAVVAVEEHPEWRAVNAAIPQIKVP